MKFNVTLHTDGKGIWSGTVRPVKVYRISCNNRYHHPDLPELGGELRVYFTKRSWDVSKHGLIYTDALFLRELRYALSRAGIRGRMDYSEQGMQGDDYVSLDVSAPFIERLKVKAGRRSW